MPNLLSRFKSSVRSLLPSSGKSSPVRSDAYKPLPSWWFQTPRDLPPFNSLTIRSMLIDPGIRLNLAMRSAPIYGVEFAYQDGMDANNKPKWTPGIKCKNPAVAAWLMRQINTIWHNYLPDILLAQVYGWSGGEMTIRLSPEFNLIEVDKLIARHPADIRLLKRSGSRAGIQIRRITTTGTLDLEFPYAWWHSFRPSPGEDYGTSILLGAYSPWADKWFNGGALDTRRLFMHKDAYGGMKVGYPEEDLYIEGQANPIKARDIAMQIAEQRKNGGTITYPSTMDNSGKPKWIIDEATVSSNPQHILQFPKDLDDEIRQGMEIPDGVIDDDGAGAWAGKRIQMAAFYAGLDTWIVQMLADLRLSLEPLILWNWGEAVDFEICHKPLALQAMEQQGQAGGPPEQRPEQRSSFTYDGFNEQQPQRMSAKTNEEEKILTAAAAVRAVKRMSLVEIDEQPKEHKYGCVMFAIPSLDAELALQIGKDLADQLSDDAFAPDGLEMEPHVTGLYGLTACDVDEVVAFVSKLSPPRITFGTNDHFPAGKDGVPVFIQIESEDLHRINQQLKDAFPHIQTHPVYRPHMTIGYVKASVESKLDWNTNSLTGVSTYLTKAIVSMPGSDKVYVPLAQPGA